MASPSPKDGPGGRTTLKTTTTLTTHGIAGWLFDVDRVSSCVEHTSGQAGHKPIPDASIELVLRPPDHTTTHSPQSRIAPSVDSRFLTHR